MTAPAQGGFPSYEDAVQAVADLSIGPLPPLDFERILAVREHAVTRDAAALILRRPIKDLLRHSPHRRFRACMGTLRPRRRNRELLA